MGTSVPIFIGAAQSFAALKLRSAQHEHISRRYRENTVPRWRDRRRLIRGTVKQSADLNQMIWSVAEQISTLSEAFELMAGCIIYTGTPENVGPVVRGDVVLGKLVGLPDINVKVV
jgi:2-keto-4-pentenoate hydratase/2-oxohepta-3-ene-1,7-dioic acid hydratase in catechol pathway